MRIVIKKRKKEVRKKKYNTLEEERPLRISGMSCCNLDIKSAICSSEIFLEPTPERRERELLPDIVFVSFKIQQIQILKKLSDIIIPSPPLTPLLFLKKDQ